MRTPPPAIVDRLAHERNAWLCTVRPDGSPHVTPVWFVYRHDSWWIGTDEGAVKLRNIEKTPWVSLALEGGDAPVVAEGTATALRDTFPADITAAFSAKYDWDVTAPERPGSDRVLLKVPVRRWLLTGVAQ